MVYLIQKYQRPYYPAYGLGIGLWGVRHWSKLTGLSLDLFFNAMKQIAIKCLLALALTGFCSISAVSQGLCDAAQPIAQIERTVQRGGDWVERASVGLMDRLERDWQNEATQISYRFALPGSGGACAAAQPRALYLYRVGAPYRLEIDGKPVSAVAPFAPARAGAVYNGRVPALFALPPGAQTAQITLATLPYVPTGVVRAAVGPLAALASEHAFHYGGIVLVNDLATAAVLTVAILALTVWWMRRGDRALLWFALACLAWALRGVVYQVFVLPPWPLLFEQFNPSMVLLTGALVTASVLSSLRTMTGRRGWALAAMVLLGFSAVGLSLALGAYARPVRMAVFAVAMLTLAALPRLLLARRRQLGRTQVLFLLAGYVLTLGGALHDIMLVTGPLTPDHWSFLTPGFTVLLLCYAIVSSQYLARNLTRAEQANQELEGHIASKTQQLQASYALLGESEREAARMQERAHWTREMHDGIGAQLITALRGVERGAMEPPQVTRALQDALDELRLLMDSSDPQRSLQSALAGWRNLWEQRLAALGLTLVWQVDDALDGLHLDPNAVLQVTRILQEATTNAVKHAQATELVMRVQRMPQGVLLLVEDNGCGLPDAQPGAGPSKGRGLRNMAHRAQALGGALEIGRRPAPLRGTRLALHLPMATHHEMAAA